MAAITQIDCILPAAQTRPEDMRQHQRIVCVDGGVLRLAVRPEFRGRRALMLDVSAGGIGLVLQDPLDIDTVFVFEVQGSAGLEAIGRLARVRHCRPHATPPDAPWLPPTPLVSRIFRSMFRMEAPPDSSAWFAGCEFDRPLDDAELRQLTERLQASPLA